MEKNDAPEIIALLDSGQYSEALINFCTIFEHSWANANIINWMPTKDNVPATLRQLKSDLAIVSELVESTWQHIGTLESNWKSNGTLWVTLASDEGKVLDLLKCILHDILDNLRKINFLIDSTLGETISEQVFLKDGYKTIIMLLRMTNLFVEKAFPLLREKKSYLEIDWSTEQENLWSLVQQIVME
jgi:hypothetical protein